MKIIRIFSLYISFYSFALFGQETKKIMSFNEVELEKIDSHSLVVTDINDTIVSCADPLYQKASIKALPTELSAKISAFTTAQKNYLANLMIAKCKNHAIGDSVNFFKILLSKKVSTMALTAAFSGNFEKLNMKEHIFYDLRNLGIVFQQDFAKTKSFEFNTLKQDPISKSFPIFYKNIAFSSGSANSKGAILKSFLQASKKKPSKIHFFDDSIEHIDSVSSIRIELGIPIFIYQFTPPGSGLEKLRDAKDLSVWQEMITKVRNLI